MSEALDAPEADDIDLSGVPMDGAETADRDEGGEGEGAAASAGQPAPAPLAADELQRRYDNTRVALQQERSSRRELERRLSALETHAPTETAERPAAPEADIDPDVDPIGAMKQMRAKIRAYEAADRQETQTQAERQAQDRRFQAVEAQLAEHEGDFREEHADYDNAAAHYAHTRATELAAFGLQPQQIVSVLREEFVKLAQTAIGARKNPAAVVYEMAKSRGYTPGGQPAAGDGQGRERGADGRFKPAPAAGGKLDAVAAGQRATSPMGRAGGRPNPGLDATTVANINIRDRKGGEAFDKAFAALERQAKAAER